MKKLADLHKYFQSFDKLLDPDNVSAFAEQGTIVFSNIPDSDQNKGFVDEQAQPGNISFGIEYKAYLDFTDYVGDFNVLIFLLLRKLKTLQPGLKRDAVSFHIDILDQKRTDISFSFLLTETVAVTARNEGGHDVDAITEPNAFDLKML